MPEITYTAGSETLTGYLATPQGKGPWPGVIVLFEITGLTADTRAQADRFAANGYLAFAPDLYRGRSYVRCVRKAISDLLRRRGRIFDDIEAARAWLGGREDSTGRVGVIGFCMGGGFALVAAARYDFQAASANYALVPLNAEKALAGACPIVASYGARDLSLRGAAAKLERTLTVLDVTHDVKEYPKTGHSFLTDSEVPPVLNAWAKVVIGHGKGKENADDGWRRIMAFFGEHVAGELAKKSTT